MMAEERQQVAVMATEAESDGSHLDSQARDRDNKLEMGWMSL